MRELRKVISATELELHELHISFEGHGDQRPSLVIEVRCNPYKTHTFAVGYAIDMEISDHL